LRRRKAVRLSKKMVAKSDKSRIIAGVGFPIQLVRLMSAADFGDLNTRHGQILIDEQIRFSLMPPHHKYIASAGTHEPILDQTVQCASLNILVGIVASIKFVPSTKPLSVPEASQLTETLLTRLTKLGWAIIEQPDSPKRLLAALVNESPDHSPECIVARAKWGDDEIVTYAKATISDDDNRVIGVTLIISAENVPEYVELLKAAASLAPESSTSD
jgi:hypothetical protein